MARTTLEALRKRKEELERQRQEMRKASDGSSARADLHDSASLVHARAQISASLDKIGDLDHVKIITLPENPTRVQLGTLVTLYYASDEGNETGIYLSADDAAVRKERIISNESPIGRAIAGKTEGETVDLVTPGGKDKVTIRKIERWEEK